MSVLEELYYGNIRPDSKVYPPNSPFVEAAKFKNINLGKYYPAWLCRNNLLFLLASKY